MDTRYRRSIFWPLLLIAIGVVFLLNTLGYIQGNGWDLFLKLWPLLFIIGGLDNLFQGRGYIWAVISLGLGTVFLLATFDFVSWSALSLLLRLWPLLLIAAGLDLIFRGRSIATTLVGVLLAIVVVGGIIWLAFSGVTGTGAEPIPLSEPLGGATSLDVYISNPAGRVDISSASSGGLAFEGSLRVPNSQSVDHRYQVRNGIGGLRITGSGAGFLPWGGGFDQPLWAIDLSREAPIALKIETAAGEQRVDLRGLMIESLDLSVAVGQLDVTLPESGEFDGKLSNPVGLIRIYIPRGALVELRTNGVFQARSIPPGFNVSGGRIYSPGADSGNAQMRIEINQPIGQLVILEAR